MKIGLSDAEVASLSEVIGNMIEDVTGLNVDEMRDREILATAPEYGRVRPLVSVYAKLSHTKITV